MRVLVTGGSGALGSEVCRRLAAEGHYVVAFDRLVPETHSANQLVQGDIRDGLALAEAARRHGIEALVHLASLLTFDTASNPRRGVEINCLGMVNALDVARLLDLRRFVFASTAGIFATAAGPEPIPNDAPFSPADIYGGTKILNELLAQHYRQTAGLETIGLRFPVMLGPTQAPSAPGRLSLVAQLWTELVDKPVRGTRGVVPYGDEVINWLWIGDAARAITTALFADAPESKSYNVGGDVRSMVDAVRIVERLVPGAEIELEPGRFGLEFRLETSETETQLGFRPEWRLEDQLGELIRRSREQVGVV